MERMKIYFVLERLQGLNEWHMVDVNLAERSERDIMYGENNVKQI